MTDPAGNSYPESSLGSAAQLVEDAIADLQTRRTVERIWERDHTVWRPEPTEIANRLGWLDVSDVMREQVPGLEAFAWEVRDAGFLHVALLGMGGSSLGPEVLRKTFGSAEGYPELIVLDSTVPGWINMVTEAIEPAKTLFLVSSKSGSTIEPLSFYSYFRRLVEQHLREGAAGNFVAITDPGTSLAELAQEQGFRRVFPNPPDIGGRYSVLSYFGLAPAALTGIDIGKLLDRADLIRGASGPSVAVGDNPGAWLGVVMGTLAKSGRDKLTLVTSPSIAAFGLWAEQLLAESTGKEGTGIIPVAGEPLLSPEHYGDDRFFVYLRVEKDDNAATDGAVDRLRASGHPIVRLDLRDPYDLGGEFWRWEFATAVAGAVLDIHPFDQPNVQQAKDLTDSVLQSYVDSGDLPEVKAGPSVDKLLSQARHGDYLSIMAYLRQTPEVDRSLEDLRRRVTERHRIATTSGYGPRFLHSTGQLHKGGPNSGLFLQITEDQPEDVLLPGQRYSFEILSDAQSLGDLQALRDLGRRVTRVHLGSEDVATAIGKLVRG